MNVWTVEKAAISMTACPGGVKQCLPKVQFTIKISSMEKETDEEKPIAFADLKSARAMVFKRKYAIIPFITDLGALAFIVSAFFILYEAVKNYSFGDLEGIVAVGIFGLTCFTHLTMGLKLYRSPGLVLERQLILFTRYKKYSVPYEKISELDIDKTAYIDFVDEKEKKKGMYIPIHEDDFDKFLSRLSHFTTSIKINDLRC